MKAEKQIIATEPIDITIDKITLLSVEEYKRCREHIPLADRWWWLRSPGKYSYDAAIVDDYGNIDHYGLSVNIALNDVRPVVVLRLNPESANLQIGDKLYFAAYAWSMIAPCLALCDEVVGQTYFRADWRAPDANEYEKSDVKKWLEAWAKEHGIEVGA